MLVSHCTSALRPRQVPQKSLQSHWEEVPQPFLAVSGGKKKKAVAMYRNMLRWRKENEIGKEGGKEGVKGVREGRRE